MEHIISESATGGERMHRSAVISSGRVTYGNGSTIIASPALHRDLRKILDGTLGRFDEHCAIVIFGVMPDDLPGQSDALKEVGWQHSGIEAWTLFHKEGRTVAVGFHEAMGVRHFGVLFDRKTTPVELARNLDRYHQATGKPWRGTPAMTAMAGIRLSWGNVPDQPMWLFNSMPIRTQVGRLDWRRELTPDEISRGSVYTFDGNSAYLGSAITADLAFSTLTHSRETKAFDSRSQLPGYWLIELSSSTLEMMQQPGMPPLLGRHKGTQVWVTTPYAKFLHDLGDSCIAVESWTATPLVRNYGSRGVKQLPPARRVLRLWGEGLRDALAHPAAQDPQVLTALKRTYKDAIGAMQSEASRICRPDWADAVIDLWRATLFRRILAVNVGLGIWPVRVATDSVSYALREEDVPALSALLKCRPGLGGMKHEATHTCEAWIAKYPQGRRLRAVKAA